MQSEEKSIDVDPDGVRFFRSLMLRFFADHRTKEFPDARLLADLYDKTGDEFYYAALGHLILDDLQKRLTSKRNA